MSDCWSGLPPDTAAVMQALLDVYTIQRELGRLDNLRVGLVGDLANGRTVRSLAYLLSMYSGIKFYFVAPDVVRMQVCCIQCFCLLLYLVLLSMRHVLVQALNLS